jgi:intein/homing endonuclease/DNA-directed RNA polymerase subunit RPC12/RpoP
VSSEYGIKEKFAKDLDKTDRVLIAKKFNCDCKEVKTGFEPNRRIVLDHKERKKLKKARLGLGLSQKMAGEKVGLSQMVISDLETGEQTPTNENLRRIYGFYRIELDEQRLSKKTLDFPEYWNENLARLCGIICGDGTVDGNRVIIYEGSRQLVDDYCSLVKRTIGIEPKVKVVDKIGKRGSFAKKEYFEVRIYCKEFVEAVEKIAPEIISKKERGIPRDIPRCEDGIVAAFLSGLFDAEGYVHARRVDIAMVDERLIKKVQFLLLRFGILSSFSEKAVKGNRQWFICISDRDSVKRFRENMGFRRNDKKKKLEAICTSKRGQQYVDQVPIDGREVFRLAKELGLKTSDFYAASCYFRNKKPLGREAFSRNILPVFQKHRRTKRGKEIYAYLDRIHHSDFTLASIKEKVHVENKESFYDVTIPVHSNFIADGFVVHNSQRRYQRLVEEQIETYYKRVGEAMDDAFLDKVKGVIVGGPGPTKEFFEKAKTFNYQIKVMGVVDTGYTDEYGVREVLAKSEKILAEQEVVKEKVLVDRFIKEAVSDGLATYGVKQVREAILSRQAETVLLSEELEHISGTYKCGSCGNTGVKVFKEEAEESIECKKCGSKMKLEKEQSLLDELADLARENDIEVEIISTGSVEGAQFLTGFAGVGAILRYKTR